MHFCSKPRLMSLDDHELLYVRIFVEFHGISQIWEATTANWMKIATEL